MVSTTVEEYFSREYADKGIRVFAGSRDTIDIDRLEEDEKAAIRLAFRKGLEQIGMVSPKLYAMLKPQEDAMVMWGAVAKAAFPEDKVIRYPASAGTIGVDWLCPALYMYYAGESSSTYPDYCGYDGKNAVGDNWDISLEQGIAAYLAGDGTNYYKASPTTNQHSFHVLCQNGIVEVGTLPSVTQIHVKTEAMNKYSPFATSPLCSEPIEEGKQVYVYPTLGMLPMYHNFGTMVGVMPGRTGVSDIRLMGLTFYEYDLWSSLKA